MSGGARQLAKEATMWRKAIVVATVPLLFCTGSFDVAWAKGAREPRVAAAKSSSIDAATPLFDPNRVIAVDIQLDADDWNRLCAERRTFVSLFRGACLSQPFPSPFTWFRGRVTLDGITRADVAVRKKGFLGSLDDVKPSLKLSLTTFVANEPVYGLKKFTLNNAKQDPSLVRQCVGYQLFARAGVPAPRCNFATVRVNGRALGVYVNVEDVRKPMLARHFADTSGNLYEGTFSDFHPLLLKTFEEQTNERTGTHDDLTALAAALETPDAGLLQALDAVLDLDAFVRFWAMEALIGQWDGYSSNRNNFYAYHDPQSGRFHFVPWGADTILGEGWPIAALDPAANKAVFAYSAITRRLVEIPEMRARYLATMHALLDTVWDEAAINAELDRMQALLLPHAGDLSVPLASVRTFVNGQRARIADGLAAGFPQFPPLGYLDFCLIPDGSVSAAFVAEWGTSEVVPPFQTGAAMLEGTVAGTPLKSTSGGADAGPFTAHPNPHEGQLNLYVQSRGSPLAAVLGTFDPTRIAPGRVLAIDGQQFDGVIFPLDGHTPGAFLDGGSLRLLYASTQPGGKLCGVFDATTYVFALAPLTANSPGLIGTTASAPPPPFATTLGQGDLAQLMRKCQPAGR